MMMIIPNYKITFKTSEHEIELIVSGSDKVKTFIDILFFNGIDNISIKEDSDYIEKDRVYRLKVK